MICDRKYLSKQGEGQGELVNGWFCPVKKDEKQGKTGGKEKRQDGSSGQDRMILTLGKSATYIDDT